MQDLDESGHHLLAITTGNFAFQKVTQSLLYAQIIRLHYRDHHSSAKWVEKLRNPVDWDKVLTSVHNPLSTEETTSFIWEQIHLNMYTTQLHNASLCFPLCTQLVGNEYHLIFDCRVVTSLWSQIEPLPLKIHPAPVTEQKMIFGILGTSSVITLRNWFTYGLRFCFCQQEVLAYHNKKS